MAMRKMGEEKQAPESEPSSPVVSKEQAAVTDNRYREAKKAGLSRVEAQLFADSQTDVGLLRAMVKGGATHEQLCRVLL